MTDLRALLFARQRNYALIIDTTTAWAPTPSAKWGPMYRAVLAAVVKAGGITFADEVAPDKGVAEAAVRAFLDRVPTTGAISADVKLADPAAVITADDEQRARDIIDYWDPDFFLADQAVKLRRVESALFIEVGKPWGWPGPSPGNCAE